MGRPKKIEGLEDVVLNETEATEPAAVEELEKTEDAKAGFTEEKVSDQPKEAPKAAKNDDIPALADKLLKLYSKHPSLYINRFGGVFSASTKQSATNGAILYKNPYYNK